MIIKYIKTQYLLLLALCMPLAVFIFTAGKYYGFYYDNHYFNLLGLDLMQGLKPYLYLGSHYTIHSSLYSWLVLPLFHIFGPTDFSMELLSAFFHLGVVFLCFELGRKFFGGYLGLIAAFLVSIAPIYLINIYTWPEYSFIAFLNLLSIYYFLAGFKEGSRAKIVLSSILFCLSCFQAVYSVLLLPFYLIYAFFQACLFLKKNRQPNYLLPGKKRSIFLKAIIYPLGLIAFLYLIALLEAMYIGRTHRILYYGTICLAILAGTLVFNRISRDAKSILSFCLSFFIIAATALLLLDLFVQLDMNFFAQRFGYYRDTTFAGGFGTGRPPFIFKGNSLEILGRPLYLSVLSSLLAFASGYSRVSFNLWEAARTMFSYYRDCFPLAINVFFIVGTGGLSIDYLRRKYKRQAVNPGLNFCLIWLLGITLTFFNTYPQHILRIYILPMPYFIASLGVYYFAKTTQYVFKERKKIFELTIFLSVFFLVFNQGAFLKKNIFEKYKYDKNRSNYFKLFYGWPYGRSYKEVGQFLLKDAPLKKEGKFRSAFIYTIASDINTANKICAVFYNNIDWYTQNKIMIIYDPKSLSWAKYGSKKELERYLSRIFSANPDIEIIYFADFYDTKDNYSFFSKVHKDIRPYKIVNDDAGLQYDCILYKFKRGAGENNI